MTTDFRLPPKWIELNINKRECIVFIATPENGQICQCGRSRNDHPAITTHHRNTDTWIPALHTKTSPTDAYGTIIFEGEHHPNKSHYVRLSHDTNPELVIQLMNLVWGLPMPKLLITVRGSYTNFEIAPRLGKILQVGLLKAAKSTEAWIITNGLNRGVSKHIGNALGNQRLLGFKKGGRVVSVGICPFGIVQNREVLIGHNKDRPYNPLEQSSSKYIILNPRHSNFLLIDNGSVGKLGGESVFRRRLERCIGSYPTSPNRGCDTPMVCLVIGGSFNTLRNIIDYIYDEPPVPVVVVSNTGFTADLMTFVLKKIYGGIQLDEIKAEICQSMIRIHNIDNTQCDVIFDLIRRIVSRRNLITIYNGFSPDSEPFDAVLLASIFRSQHWTPLQQLSLTLVWDRVDIATHEVFVYGRDWSRETLEHAMFEALSSNRLNFVELLIEHGLNMQTFLTPKRLEELYSMDRSSIVMRTLLLELSKSGKKRKKFKSTATMDRNLSLHDIGFAMSHMMGHVYKSRYSNFKVRRRTVDDEAPAETAMANTEFYFTQPFDDLFIWAILTKRHSMSVLLWKHGVGALAKALVAVRLNKYLASEFKSAEKAESNMAAEFETNAEEWEGISYNLLDAAFKGDLQLARQLLTMELEYWSKQTCLTLAVIANHRMLLGHPCCQILLADLWMGALSVSKHTTLKVLAGVIFPPLALWCDFKTREELKLLPHQSNKEGSPNTNQEEQEIVDMDGSSMRTYSKSQASIPSSMFLLTKVHKHQNVSTNTEENQTETMGLKKRSYNNQRSEVVFKKLPAKKTVVGDADVIIVDNSVEDAAHRVTILNDITSSEESSDDDQEKVGRDIHQVGRKKLKPPKNFQNDRMGSSYVTTRQNLSLWRKLYEFQNSPMANFYRHTLGYMAFLGCLAYVILVPQNRTFPGIIEWYTIAYFFTLGCDTLREFISIDGYTWSQKWNQFQANFWSVMDFSVIIFSLCGTFLRLYPAPNERWFYDYGMLCYKVASIYWNLRLYKYLSNHRWVGPKLVMMTRMLKHMIYFSMIILVVLIAFGISREAIRFPDVAPTWRSMAEAFLEPYVMFYGEIDIDSLSPQCGEVAQPPCPPGHWIIPLTWAIYMMVANILIVNVLIAVFNGIYAEVDGISLELWMFQRFTFVMEFQSKPLLPPPMIILCHIYYVLRYIFYKCRLCMCEEESDEIGLDIEDGKRVYIGSDRSLKTFLSPSETNRVFDFEEDNLENINTVPTEMDYSARRGFADIETLKYGPKQEFAGGGHLANELSENRHIYQKITDIQAELESQKSKLDRIISYLEDDLEMP